MTPAVGWERRIYCRTPLRRFGVRSQSKRRQKPNRDRSHSARRVHAIMGSAAEDKTTKPYSPAPYGGLQPSAAGGSSRPNSEVLQHTSGFVRLDARHLPEIPSGRRSGHLSHRNQAVRRRLLQTPFPSRNHHRRAMEMLSEIELIEPKFLSQCSNPPRPCWQGRGHELTGPGHSWLQDNKSLHILRNAQFYETRTSAPVPWIGTEPSPLAIRSLDRRTAKAQPGRKTYLDVGPLLAIRSATVYHFG